VCLHCSFNARYNGASPYLGNFSVIVKNHKDLNGLLRIGQICGHALQHMLSHVQPGITTRELDHIGAAFLKQHSAQSAPIKTYDYPGWTCISINEEVAHGIPGNRVIKAGDIVNIDVSATLEGFWADTGASMLVPPIRSHHKKLMERTIDALYAGIRKATTGNRVADISRAIESIARQERYSIIRELTGHGVGLALHEEPTVPNFFRRDMNELLVEGWVFTVEPFFNLGRGKIKQAKDGWTLYTVDRSVTAQFEHTIVVQGKEPILVTKVEGGH
jgi:methionyl aminopeptidase